MTVYDLNRDQLTEVKQRMLMEQYDQLGETPSYGELADVDDLISDEEVYAEYAGTDFVPDDFFCSAGADEDSFVFTLLDNPIYSSRDDIADTLIKIAKDIRNGGVNGRVGAIRWMMSVDR